MKKLFFKIMTIMLPLSASAQTVVSPNGNVAVKFSLADGVPTYEMSYKHRAVV